MRIYRRSAATQVRVDYGVALARGLSNFDKTKPHAVAFKQLNDELDAQHKTRVALRKAWLEARQDVRFADYNVDMVLRAYRASAKIADGGRIGPISKATLPKGVTVVTAPSGASQLPALNEVVRDLVNARVEGVEAFRAAELPKLEAARTEIETAVAGYQSARDAYFAAFAVERAMRDEHRLAVTAMKGTVASLFPDDKRIQSVIFPDSTVTRGTASDDEVDDDESNEDGSDEE